MEVNIFDVAHGFCSYIVADNNNVILIDCGRNEDTGFNPTDYLVRRGCNGIELFVVSNYDEDHLSDLPLLRKKLQVLQLARNPSLGAEELEKIKLAGGPLGDGMIDLLKMIRECTVRKEAVAAPPIDFGEMEIKYFWNKYPNFDDTNNLSLVTFVNYRDIHIIFPGDLQKKGWLELLKLNLFQEYLSKVSMFVASHHGREDGLCPEVFNYCQPDLVIISDEPKQYDTQETRSQYAKFAKGVKFGDTDRFVLTTPNDGMIRYYQLPRDVPRIKTAR